ncbi:MAG: carboxypeptidase regulatory-like domain-containing protein [Ignavibacteria bacterium]|nr:carboxypeptidase regulatory-like domain-containing protein [Ignavibacteria bacterium]
MKYSIFLAITLTAILAWIAGCNVNQASYEQTAVGGTITDSSTGRPVEGVKVIIEPTYQFAFTDTNGFYYIDEINCGSSAGNYFLNFEKTGYDSMRLFTILYAGDTTKRVNWSLLNKSSNVFMRYDVTLTEYVNIGTYSNLNAFDMIAVNGGVTLVMDMTLKDSLKLRNKFYLAAGSFSEPVQGLESRFTSVLYNSLTKAEFDTLSRIDVGNRPIIPDVDFPYDRTRSYNSSSLTNEVYGFYLKGRKFIGYQYDVYGLVRINNFYLDNSSNLYKLVLDLKVNRKGQNYFLN